jgi:hypothetical protein
MNFPDTHPEEGTKTPGDFSHSNEEGEFSSPPDSPAKTSEDWDLVGDDTPKEDIHDQVDSGTEERAKNLKFVL